MRSAITLGLVMVAMTACGGEDVSRVLGARCEVTAECEDRCLVPSNDFPDGFCTADCSSIEDCPSSSDCIDKEGGVCLFVCGDDVDCDFLGPRWICNEENLREDPNTKVRVCRGD